jgi:intracellular multiplication protein IcmT
MNEWRNAAKSPRLLGVDIRATFPIALFMLHPRYWTAGVAVVLILALVILERFGFTVPVFLRWVRHKLRGPICHARPWWIRRRFFAN